MADLFARSIPHHQSPWSLEFCNAPIETVVLWDEIQILSDALDPG